MTAADLRPVFSGSELARNQPRPFALALFAEAYRLKEGWNPAKHPHLPKGSPGGHGGEFVKVGELLRALGDATKLPDREAEYRKRDLHQEGEWAPRGGGRRSYGVVMFDKQGKVLLREPTNHFDGYHWAIGGKGGQEGDEHPIDTAKREVLEETGQKVRIVGHVPGGHNYGGGKHEWDEKPREPLTADGRKLVTEYGAGSSADFLPGDVVSNRQYTGHAKVVGSVPDEDKVLVQEGGQQYEDNLSDLRHSRDMWREGSGPPVHHVSDSSTSTNYYLGVSTGEDTGAMDKETQQTRWVTPAQAEDLLAQSTNSAGRQRMLDTLHSAVAEHNRLTGEGETEFTLHSAPLPKPTSLSAPSSGHKPQGGYQPTKHQASLFPDWNPSSPKALAPPAALPKVGETMKVPSGPFAGQSGAVLAVSSNLALVRLQDGSSVWVAASASEYAERLLFAKAWEEALHPRVPSGPHKGEFAKKLGFGNALGELFKAGDEVFHLNKKTGKLEKATVKKPYASLPKSQVTLGWGVHKPAKYVAHVDYVHGYTKAEHLANAQQELHKQKPDAKLVALHKAAAEATSKQGQTDEIASPVEAKVGQRFYHAKYLDDHNLPLLCQVTATKNGSVYYKAVLPDGSLKGSWFTPADTFLTAGHKPADPDQLPKPSSGDFQPGQSVKVTGGLWQGHLATITGPKHVPVTDGGTDAKIDPSQLKHDVQEMQAPAGQTAEKAQTATKLVGKAGDGAASDFKVGDHVLGGTMPGVVTGQDSSGLPVVAWDLGNGDTVTSTAALPALTHDPSFLEQNGVNHGLIAPTSTEKVVADYGQGTAADFQPGQHVMWQHQEVEQAATIQQTGSSDGLLLIKAEPGGDMHVVAPSHLKHDVGTHTLPVGDQSPDLPGGFHPGQHVTYAGSGYVGSDYIVDGPGATAGTLNIYNADDGVPVLNVPAHHLKRATSAKKVVTNFHGDQTVGDFAPGDHVVSPHGEAFTVTAPDPSYPADHVHVVGADGQHGHATPGYFKHDPAFATENGAGASAPASPAVLVGQVVPPLKVADLKQLDQVNDETGSSGTVLSASPDHVNVKWATGPKAGQTYGYDDDDLQSNGITKDETAQGFQPGDHIQAKNAVATGVVDHLDSATGAPVVKWDGGGQTVTFPAAITHDPAYAAPAAPPPVHPVTEFGTADLGDFKTGDHVVSKSGGHYTVSATGGLSNVVQVKSASGATDFATSQDLKHDPDYYGSAIAPAAPPATIHLPEGEPLPNLAPGDVITVHTPKTDVVYTVNSVLSGGADDGGDLLNCQGPNGAVAVSKGTFKNYNVDITKAGTDAAPAAHVFKPGEPVVYDGQKGTVSHYAPAGGGKTLVFQPEGGPVKIVDPADVSVDADVPEKHGFHVGDKVLSVHGNNVQRGTVTSLDTPANSAQNYLTVTWDDGYANPVPTSALLNSSVPPVPEHPVKFYSTSPKAAFSPGEKVMYSQSYGYGGGKATVVAQNPSTVKILLDGDTKPKNVAPSSIKHLVGTYPPDAVPYESPTSTPATHTTPAHAPTYTTAAHVPSSPAYTTPQHQQQAPPAPPPANKLPDSFAALSTWTNQGGQQGSNPGGWYQAPDGTRAYVKPMDAAHAYNEVGAMAAYRAAGMTPGVDFPHTKVLKDDSGKTYVISQEIPALSKQPASWWNSHPQAQQQASKLIAVNALTAHYDAAGADMDNLLVTGDGHPVLIEAGGAMAYRAQGDPKATWNPGADLYGEVQSVLGTNPQHPNPQMKAVFGKASHVDIAQALAQLKADPDYVNRLDDLWEAEGMPPDQRQKNREVIEARLAQVDDTVKKLAPQGLGVQTIDPWANWTPYTAPEQAAPVNVPFNTQVDPIGPKSAAELEDVEKQLRGDIPDSYTAITALPQAPGPAAGAAAGTYYKTTDGRLLNVRKVNSLANAQNEVASNIAYAIAGGQPGATILPSRIVEHQGDVYVVQEMPPDADLKPAGWWQTNKASKDAMANLWAVDALLSNWNVAGDNLNKVLVDKSGIPIRMNTAGAMAARQSGGFKEQWKKGNWIEPWTMRGKNYQGTGGNQGAATIFGQISDDEAADRLEALQGMNLDNLVKAWENAGIPQNQIDANIAVIKDRLSQLKKVVTDLRQHKDVSGGHHGGLGSFQAAPPEMVTGPPSALASKAEWAQVAAKMNANHKVPSVQGNHVAVLQSVISDWKGSANATRQSVLHAHPSAGAVALYQAVDAAPANAPLLRRGFNPSWSTQQTLDFFQPGKVVPLNCSGFTTSPGTAASFGGGKLLFLLAPGAKAVNIQSQTHAYASEKEWVTQGRFLVTKVEQTPPGHGIKVYLKQVATFQLPPPANLLVDPQTGLNASEMDGV